MNAHELGFRQGPLDQVARQIFADWLLEQGREMESAEIRSGSSVASGPPKRRWGHRYCGYGGYGGSGGDGGYGGYGGYGGSGG